MIHSRKRASSAAPWTTQYYLSDRLSVRMTLDSSGNLLGRQAHLPFGEDFGESGTQEKHHFTTYERDGESGVDYAINRGYSQSTGRFTRPDPLPESAGKDSPRSWNRYSYSLNDPVNMVDPWGLEPFACPQCIGPPLPPHEPCRPFGVSYLRDGFDLYPRIFCGGASPSPRSPEPEPEQLQPTVNYTDLSYRVYSFFSQRVNCLSYFLGKGIYDAFLARAESGKYIDFDKDPHNRLVAQIYTFREISLTSNSVIADRIIYLHLLASSNASTWRRENTITVGAAFYFESPFDRDRIIVHEVLHFFYGNHREIAEGFLGLELSDRAASDAINNFLKQRLYENYELI